MNRICCIGLSLAAKMIGTYTMSLSILMINVLMSKFFSRERDDEFFDAIGNWALIGYNWAQILRSSQLQNKVQTVMLCFLIYTVLFLLASTYLALGSISRRAKCAVPWMYLQMISIIDQAVALSIHLTHAPQYDVYDKSIWYIPLSSVYLLLSTYFWMVVQAAKREWTSTSQENCDEVNLAVISTPAISSSSELKSPSYISQNFAMFQSPRPPVILPK